MWRAFFLALGGTLCVIGLESLVLDHAVLASDAPLVRPPEATEPVYDEFGFEVARKPIPGGGRVITPPDWAPWSLLSSGAVIVLYAIAYRSGGED